MDSIVKFRKCTTNYYSDLVNKDENTLYFVNDLGDFSSSNLDTRGKLYLGSKEIGPITVEELQGYLGDYQFTQPKLVEVFEETHPTLSGLYLYQYDKDEQQTTWAGFLSWVQNNFDNTTLNKGFLMVPWSNSEMVKVVGIDFTNNENLITIYRNGTFLGMRGYDTPGSYDWNNFNNNYEVVSNKLTSTDTLDQYSTDEQYVSAKLVYILLQTKQDKITVGTGENSQTLMIN